MRSVAHITNRHQIFQLVFDVAPRYKIAKKNLKIKILGSVENGNRYNPWK